MTRLVMWPNRVTTRSRSASPAGERILRADDAPAEAQLVLLPRRGAQLARAAGIVPPPLDGPREHAGRSVRPGREPLVELRSVAARGASVPAPLPALPGAEGALLAATRLWRLLLS